MTAHSPDFSLTDLSEAILMIDAAATLERLASYGCKVERPDYEWRQLSGGREYATFTAGPVRISGLASNLSMEISRASNDPGHGWADSIELSPADTGDSTWLEGIRNLLLQAFQRISSGSESGAEIYRRGSLEQGTLFPGPTPQAARLILHRREAIRSKV